MSVKQVTVSVCIKTILILVKKVFTIDSFYYARGHEENMKACNILTHKILADLNFV